MTDVKAIEDSVEELLAEARDRSVMLELHYEDPSGALVIGKTRIRALREGRILADSISLIDKSERIPLGRPLCAHFTIRGKRLQFETDIEGDRVPVGILAGERMLGIALRRPKKLTESQRRTHVRISVAAGDAIQVCVSRPSPKTPNACSMDGEHAVARLLNVSAGGMTILLPSNGLARCKVNDRFFLTFALPDIEGEFHLVGSLRHTRKVETSGSLRGSFAFKPWDGNVLRLDQRRIERFIVERERVNLRRRR